MAICRVSKPTGCGATCRRGRGEAEIPGLGREGAPAAGGLPRPETRVPTCEPPAFRLLYEHTMTQVSDRQAFFPRTQLDPGFGVAVSVLVATFLFGCAS